MLHAILQKISKRLPDAKFVAAPNHESPYEKRAKLGLYQKVWFSAFTVPVGMHLGKHLPKRLREYYGLVHHGEIDIVLDASGFSYSDYWGYRTSVLMAKAVKKWKLGHTKVILLPQAMGPFSTRKIRKAFAQILEMSDLVFPRDEISFRHVTDLVGRKNHIIQSPDFTNLVQGVVPESFFPLKNRFCLIPNYRMIDKTTAVEGKKYISFLASCANHLLRNGIRPFILIHEGEKDLRLAIKVNRLCNESMPTVTETDPLAIKGIIGICNGVISSRYHGLISALSQGVPALATGWSHKYEALFSEYGIPGGCL